MYTPQKFSFAKLDGISEKQLDVHVKLYEGYVKFINTLAEVQTDLLKDSEKNAYALSEVTRRIGFEFNGMRMHELYFAQWQGSSVSLPPELDARKAELAAVAMMRGIGWALLSKDNKTKELIVHWVSDHELGQLNDTTTIIALDMWEHAYMVDYTPAEKKQYVEAFFKNLNGNVVDKRFAA